MTADTDDDYAYLTGNGVEQPLGVITVSGEIIFGRPNCPR